MISGLELWRDIPAKPRNCRELVKGNAQSEMKEKTEERGGGGEDENIGRQQFKASHTGVKRRLGGAAKISMYTYTEKASAFIIKTK